MSLGIVMPGADAVGFSGGIADAEVSRRRVIAWLDAGQPDPDTAADTINEVIGAAVTAIAAASSSG